MGVGLNKAEPAGQCDARSAEDRKEIEFTAAFPIVNAVGDRNGNGNDKSEDRSELMRFAELVKDEGGGRDVEEEAPKEILFFRF